MATTERDLYELLGVSRSADESELKKAFRRRARELHPDVSEAPDAETRFREVVEAYEVLSKRETRELYDRFGHAGLRNGGFRPSSFDFGNLSDLFSAFFGDDLFGVGGRGQARGGDIAAEIEIELADAARGARREVPVDVAVACSTCGGDGAKPGTSPAECPTCAGAGRLQQISRSVLGEFVRTQTCPRCAGVGRVVTDPCPGCEGDGRVIEQRRLEVDIPPGIHDGQRIRISGGGHSGQLGGRAGDLYVLLRIRPDPHLAREGNDIFSTVELTMTQAALGTSVTIPTLEGERTLSFEPGTQPGDVVVLRGVGMPVLQGFGRGDHRVFVNVAIPRRLTEEQRRALEAFERGVRSDTYRADEGFFEKLKNAFR